MQTSNSATPNQFSLLLRVRYGECDGQQVVFNARYADYIDIAMTEYFRVAVGGFQELIKQGLDNQVVSLHLDWFSSARFDDLLSISVSTSKVGNTSYAFELDISQHSTGKRVAKGAITYVLVDTKNYQKTSVPDWLRTTLLSTEKLPLVNQAGVAW